MNEKPNEMIKYFTFIVTFIGSVRTGRKIGSFGGQNGTNAIRGRGVQLRRTSSYA